MHKPHIMLDLETMSSQSNAAIVSIGACTFDTEGVGDTFYAKVMLRTSVLAGLHVDPDTIMWWLRQSDAARDALQGANLTLYDALEQFSQWALLQCSEPFVWGNGATFDNVVLSNAYATSRLVKRPWSYKNDRCYRTLKALYPNVPMPAATGEAHNALDDAVYQATHAVMLLRELEVPCA